MLTNDSDVFTGYLLTIDEPESVPCGLCGTPTNMTGTERCDRCWELEKRVKADPSLALKILSKLAREAFDAPK